MSKEFVQQQRTAQDQEGYDQIVQKSIHSDPPTVGYAKGNVQFRPLIETYSQDIGSISKNIKLSEKNTATNSLKGNHINIIRGITLLSHLENAMIMKKIIETLEVEVQIRKRTRSNLERTIFETRVTDKSSKFQRSITQQIQGFKLLGYNNKPKHRIQEKTSNILTRDQRDSQLIQIAQRKFDMLILLKWLKTNRSFYQAVYKGEVLGRI
ncbi:MAG: hypothetical protein EZS28_035329, partial [Streblomastix strix]